MNVSPTHAFSVESVAFWAPTLPGWNHARAAFRGEAEPAAQAAPRPAPTVLAAAERRRATDTVALALEVADAAIRSSGLGPAHIPSVFTSAHGDLAVNDYMCRTLATTPHLISPTKFHNSVHNAAAGYWTIGTDCHEASTSLSAFDRSFAAGLLEAATQCEADDRVVLLVASDVESVGALATVTDSRGLLACAMVLAPAASARSVATFEWTLVGEASPPAQASSTAGRSLAGNAMSPAVPFFEALALESVDAVDLPLSLSLTLRLQKRRDIASRRE